MKHLFQKSQFHPSFFILYPIGVWQPVGFVIAAVLAGVLVIRLPMTMAAGVVFGTAVALMIICQPLLGLALALLLGPLGALENIVFGSSLLDSGQFMLLVTLAAWGGYRLSRRQIIIPQTYLNKPLLLLLFVFALTLVRAPSFSFGLKELLKWLEMGIIMFLVVDLSAGDEVDGHRPKPFYIVGMLLLAGFSQALIGIWQFGFREDGPEHFLVLGRFYRAYGTFEQPNPYAGYLNLTALLAVGVLLGLVASWWRSWRQREISIHPWRSPFFLLFLTLGITALTTTAAVIFSWSRGAWLSLGAGTAVLVLFWPRKLWQGIGLVAIAGVLFLGGTRAGLIPASMTERITSFRDDLRFGDVRGEDINDANYAVLERLAHWQAAVDMARDHIWLGVGLGNYEPAYADYALVNWPYPLGHAHNYYLNLLAETGAFGLGAYLLFWTAVFWQTIRLLRRLDWPYRGFALGLLAAWVSLSVHHLVDKLYVNNIYIHLGVMLGLLQLSQNMKVESKD